MAMPYKVQSEPLDAIIPLAANFTYGENSVFVEITERI